jgi:hypothetical protein
VLRQRSEVLVAFEEFSLIAGMAACVAVSMIMLFA